MCERRSRITFIARVLQRLESDADPLDQRQELRRELQSLVLEASCLGGQQVDTGTERRQRIVPSEWLPSVWRGVQPPAQRLALEFQRQHASGDGVEARWRCRVPRL